MISSDHYVLEVHFIYYYFFFFWGGGGEGGLSADLVQCLYGPPKDSIYHLETVSFDILIRYAN